MPETKTNDKGQQESYFSLECERTFQSTRGFWQRSVSVLVDVEGVSVLLIKHVPHCGVLCFQDKPLYITEKIKSQSEVEVGRWRGRGGKGEVEG